MKSGAPAFGTPEYMKTAIIGGQLARRLELPYRSSNANAANSLDAQAAYESVFSLWGAIMGGVNLLMHGAGWMEGGLQASFEKMALDADLLAMVAEFLKPVGVDEGELALEAMREVGPGGHFFGAAHTQSRYRHAFFAPMISDWRNYESWREAGAPTAYDAAERVYKERLRTYAAARFRTGAPRGARRLRRPAQSRGRRARRTFDENAKRRVVPSGAAARRPCRPQAPPHARGPSARRGRRDVLRFWRWTGGVVRRVGGDSRARRRRRGGLRRSADAVHRRLSRRDVFGQRVRSPVRSQAHADRSGARDGTGSRPASHRRRRLRAVRRIGRLRVLRRAGRSDDERGGRAHRARPRPARSSRACMAERPRALRSARSRRPPRGERMALGLRASSPWPRWLVASALVALAVPAEPAAGGGGARRSIAPACCRARWLSSGW